MRMPMRHVVAAVCITVCGLEMTPANQVRDRRASDPVAAAGTGVVSGVVVSAEDPRQPIRRAIVSISGDDLPIGRTLISGADGRFAFTNVPVGKFTLKAYKGGYLPTTLGAKWPGQRGTVLVIGDAEQIVDVILRMPRGAVITGTVTSPRGEAMPGMQVTAVSVDSAERQPFVSFLGPVNLTDDSGAYRIFGLPPGDYFVVVSPPRLSTTAGAAAARSSAEIDAIFRFLRGQSQSEMPGARPASRIDPPGEKPPAYGYAPVFHPGSPSAAEAATITIASGQERHGVDIVMDLVRTAVIEGTVTNAQGVLPPLTLSIAPQGPRLHGLSGAPVLAQPAGPDGRFRYAGVAPGQYTIIARSSGGSSSGRMGGAGGSAPATPLPPSTQVLWALADVAVQGEDVAVSLDLQPALRVSGQARFEGTSQPPEPLTSVRVTLAVEGSAGMSVSNNTAIGVPPVPPATLRPDGTFDVIGVLPGTYRLSTTLTGTAAWWLRSAMIGGRDVLDVPLVVGRDHIGGAVLTFSDRQTELSGRLQRADGTPAFESTIVVFSANRETWRKGARRIQTAVPSSDGHYAIHGLPGGDYLIAVMPDVDPARLYDREFLARLAAASMKITLADGEKKRQDLQLQ